MGKPASGYNLKQVLTLLSEQSSFLCILPWLNWCLFSNYDNKTTYAFKEIPHFTAYTALPAGRVTNDRFLYYAVSQ
jgi:hypothetical protein